MRDRDELRAVIEQGVVGLLDDLAAVIDRRHAQDRALLLAQHLPRHDVRVVLKVGHDDLVAGPDELAAVAMHHEVHAFRAAGREDDLAILLRIEEALDAATRAFVGLGRHGGQQVNTAMDVRVLVRLVTDDPVDHLLGHLAGRRVVQERQRLAVGPHVMKDREIGPDALDVERGDILWRFPKRGGAHAISCPPVCSSRRAARLFTMDAMGMRFTMSAANP